MDYDDFGYATDDIVFDLFKKQMPRLKAIQAKARVTLKAVEAKEKTTACKHCGALGKYQTK